MLLLRAFRADAFLFFVSLLLLLIVERAEREILFVVRQNVIAVAVQLLESNSFGSGNFATVFFARVFKINGFLGIVLAKQIGVLAFVAGRDEFFQPQLHEFVGKIMEEIADARVVAIAKNDFAFEMLLVMAEFLFDVGKLRVKLILFRFPCLVQI